jgi:FAD/FMN-containing dehydrogenase
MARHSLGGMLSAFEFMDARSIAAVDRQSPQLLERLKGGQRILPRESQFLSWQDWERERERQREIETETQQGEREREREAGDQGIEGEILILMEITGNDPDTDTIRVDRFMEDLISSEGEREGTTEREGERQTERESQRVRVLEAVLASDSTQEQALWSIRETVPVALMQSSRERGRERQTETDSHGVRGEREREIVRKLFKYDISLSLEDTGLFLMDLKRELARDRDRERDVRESDRERECDRERESGGERESREREIESYHGGFHIAGFGERRTERERKTASLERERERENQFETVLEFCNFGHAGDQNLHLNILAHIYRPCSQSSPSLVNHITNEEYIEFIHEVINEKVFELVIQRNGK